MAPLVCLALLGLATRTAGASAENCAGMTPESSTFATTAIENVEEGNTFLVFNPTFLSAINFTSGTSSLTNFTLWDSNQTALSRLSRICPANHQCTIPLDQPVKLYPNQLYSLSFSIRDKETMYFVVLDFPLTLPRDSDNGAWQMVNCCSSQTIGAFPATPCSPQDGQISSQLCSVQGPSFEQVKIAKIEETKEAIKNLALSD